MKQNLKQLKQFSEFCKEFRRKNIYSNLEDNNAKFKIEKEKFFKKNKFSCELQKLLTTN